MADSNKKEESTTSFTVDAEKSGFVEMPSVTRLLNRKSLKLSKNSEESANASSAPQAAPEAESPGLAITLEAVSAEASPVAADEATQGITLAPPPEAEPAIMTTAQSSVSDSSSASPGDIAIAIETSQDFQLETTARPESNPAPSHAAEIALSAGLELTPPPAASVKPAGVKVQPAARKSERKPVSQLVLWEIERLKAGADPLGQGVGVLFAKGAYSALFLAITPPVAGSPVPHFLAKAAIAPGPGKQALWNGLRWDPKVAPDVWNQFVRSGVLELPPPGTQTQASSNRNMVRAAFGVEPGEWLTIVRAGPPNSCRGLVALVSKSSILSAAVQTLPILSTLPGLTRAAA